MTGMFAARMAEAGGLPVLSESFVRNGMHIGGRVLHRRNGQFLVAMQHQRAVFNVQLTLAMLRQALFAMQKILVNRIPMLFIEPRPEYVPAVRRYATAWRQLWVTQHWPAGLLTNKAQLKASRGKYTNITPRGLSPSAAFLFTTRGARRSLAMRLLLLLFFCFCCVRAVRLGDSEVCECVCARVVRVCAHVDSSCAGRDV